MNQGEYDLLVIGGGINGAGVANLASLSGLKVALLEKEDFASGTSSKSTKLIHGGLRYLQNFEFGLVKESLRERAIQLRSAPHLVRPLGFIIPFYKTDPIPAWVTQSGVWLYDRLASSESIHPHRQLTREEVIHLVPDIEEKNLTGGLMYYDAQMDDARLVLENVLNAAEHGAHVANYVEVKSFLKENGKAVGVKAYDVVGQTFIEVRARRVVCAAGPWTNTLLQKDSSKMSPKVRCTKGVHLVLREKICPHAVFLPVSRDQRFIFMIPWKNRTLVGTTDTPYDGNPDDVSVEETDIHYLLDELQQRFPHRIFKEEDIVGRFAGLRPLVHAPGRPSKISRHHAFETSYSDVFYIFGGKYTTYRKIAEDCLKKITDREIVKTEDKISLYGGGPMEKDLLEVARKYDLPSPVMQILRELYGSRAEDVLSLTKEESSLKDRVFKRPDVIKAQIVYAVRKEMAVTVEDILERRLGIAHIDGDRTACEAFAKSVLEQDRQAVNKATDGRPSPKKS